MRVPAGEIDGLVLGRLHALISSRQELANALDPLDLTAKQLDLVLQRAAELDRQWLTIPPDDMRALARQITSRVTLSPDQIEIVVGTGKLAGSLGYSVSLEKRTEPTIVLSIAAELRRAGKGKRMAIGEQNRAEIDLSLVRLMQEAFAARNHLLADTTESINAITARLAKSKGRMTSLMRLSYLAPPIIDDILSGRQPPELSAKRLLQLSRDLPLDWASQRIFLRFD